MEHVVITVSAGEVFRGVIRLVVGGIGSRCGLSFDHVDELQLAVEALLDHRDPADETIELDAAIDENELVLIVGPFLTVDDDAAGQRVTSALVDRVRTIEREEHDWMELAVLMPTPAEAGA
jgi:hypothetical protein